jgi:uncharacterized damage-inducible protein DinB
MSASLVLFRHKTWATLRLIEYCQGLEAEHLDAAIPGSYGTIRQTLRHIVGADEGYFSILTREPFPTREAAAAFVNADPLPEGPVPFDVLAERIRRLGPRWEELAEDADLAGREVTSTDGWRWPAAVILGQAIHHAADHRTHIMSILGARGLELPGPNDLDLWGYAEALDLAKPI